MRCSASRHCAIRSPEDRRMVCAVGTYTLTTLGASTELLDLPFGVPLAEWDDARIVHVPRGLSRHVVRFVRLADGAIFAIKEAPDRYVSREHVLLRRLADD